ncbi:MAG: alpha/beta hydrolase [Vicinamibacterales bacterium]|jgi:pimeloyl-ACP methyl ester carboxylesterase|nr:alpha/beta hydrolase [Acidobacteriota bacterium]MDP6371138.1 alpha/beta hydrolase [Vicinamibacterales bacterium]MDP6607971.1 alpha/beta hydrolase [Vicinamibacterales bacterium]HAK57170.1 alpha/beta hydrolase [Acidobacteriota bacterium]|tara:strand:- start:189 stop:1202 length:1014 start_codon:yes stop_codon:yes gene_type:complete
MNRTRYPHARLLGVLVVLAVMAAPALAQRQAPADYGPRSINLEDLPYPHPVSYLEFALYGQDVRMAYMDVAPVGAANGQTVVLLHGGNFFAEYWKGTIEVLRNEGFRVIATDRIGWGRSSKPIVPYTLNDQAVHLKMLLDEKGIAEAAIVGHSMGGMVTSRFAFQYPEMTTHAVMVNQIGLTDARLQRRWRNPENPYQGNQTRTYESIRRGFERYFITWSDDYEYFIKLHWGWTQSGAYPQYAAMRSLTSGLLYADPVVYDWPHIKAKTLVIGGREDGPDYPALAKNVADTIPNGQLILIDNVGHLPHLEAPERFHTELVRFLKSDPIPYTEEQGQP